ncbi:hypothetical protein E3T61_14165 [Cryobacterium lactosi]|uniref:Uncharacterized protein n=1 Tax=Cryobacterium lactosi TaxID=1259202 RepID=A0A4R9BM53_9MICO|nr:hypothetical protein [Cryobacterium lactosi]TFD87008.1 hypothetical protein E3T61_14165 [Cryobacterium lactosi]
MKSLDLVLNAVIVLPAALFLAYIGYYYFDFGLFMMLPNGITEFFLGIPAIQYVALAVALAAIVAKIALRGSIKRQEMENHI